MPQNTVSDQGIHCLQIVNHFSLGIFKSHKPDIPKIEISIFQYIVWGSSFSLQWVKKLLEEMLHNMESDQSTLFAQASSCQYLGLI